MPEEFQNFLDNKNVYAESGSVIKLLIDNFGKAKLLDFLRRQSGITDDNTLKNIFKEVYGGNLNYKFFNDLKEK